MKQFVLGIAVGAALLGVAVYVSPAPPASAQDVALGGIKGGAEAGVVDEEFEWKGSRGEERQMRLRRIVVKVPRYYGQITSISGGPDQMLWFADKDGNLRNVVIGPKLVKIQYDPAPREALK